MLYNVYMRYFGLTTKSWVILGIVFAVLVVMVVVVVYITQRQAPDTTAYPITITEYGYQSGSKVLATTDRAPKASEYILVNSKKFFSACKLPQIEDEATDALHVAKVNSINNDGSASLETEAKVCERGQEVLVSELKTGDLVYLGVIIGTTK